MKRNYSAILLVFLAMLVLPGIINAEPVKAESTSSIQINTSNGVIKLDSLKGQVVYLDFWASWCAPCKKSFPWLNQIHTKYGEQGFKVIAVNLDRDQELAKRFLKHHPARFEIGYDPEGKIASQLKVQGMPSSFLIDRKGNIVSSHVGFKEKNIKSLEAEIESLLSK